MGRMVVIPALVNILIRSGPETWSQLFLSHYSVAIARLALPPEPI